MSEYELDYYSFEYLAERTKPVVAFILNHRGRYEASVITLTEHTYFTPCFTKTKAHRAIYRQLKVKKLTLQDMRKL
jgi:hypothetical protein